MKIGHYTKNLNNGDYNQETKNGYVLNSSGNMRTTQKKIGGTMSQAVFQSVNGATVTTAGEDASSVNSEASNFASAINKENTTTYILID